VLLTGEGSDELFGGYKWQASTIKLWRQSWLRRLFRSKARNDRKFAELRRAPFRNSLGRASSWDRNIVLRSLSPELNFLQTKLFDRLDGVAPPGDRAFLASCFYDLYSHLQDLLHRHDRLSMAASVELRVPFLENRLIDFAIHLPRRHKYRGGTSKWLLKRVAETHLPRENIRAPKNGFQMSEAFSAGAQGLLRGGLLRDAMRWSAAEVEDLVAMARSQEPTRLRLVGMEMLLRLYLGGETPDRLTEALHAEAASAK
jgi:asparagine synthase (glutamine-hydrolysing)